MMDKQPMRDMKKRNTSCQIPKTLGVNSDTHTPWHKILAGGCGGECGQEALNQGQLHVKYKTDKNLSSFHQESPRRLRGESRTGSNTGNCFYTNRCIPFLKYLHSIRLRERENVLVFVSTHTHTHTHAHTHTHTHTSTALT